MYLCKSLTHASLPEIGRSFGGKHHSTVIHSIRKVEDLRKKDTDFNTLIGTFSRGFQVDFHSFPQRSCARPCGKACATLATRVGASLKPVFQAHVFCTT